jgi:hypothetical protein
VPKVLELPHFSQHYRVAEMYIRTGRVQAEFYAKLPPCFRGLGKFFGELGLGKNLDRPALKPLNLFFDFRH